MLELKFKIVEIEQLINQGDAEYMNTSDKELVRIYQNLYRKEEGYYYNIEQRLKMKEQKT